MTEASDRTPAAGNGFVPVELTRRAAILLHGDLDTVFPLFGPIREADWADGWSPILISRDVEPMREGCVFQTEHKLVGPKGETLDATGLACWVLAQYERYPAPENPAAEGTSPSVETARVQYVMISPESHVARIKIDLRADPTATRAEIVYEFTGLTEGGNEYVKRHTAEYFTNWIHEWKVAIEHYLRTGTRLQVGKADQAHH